MDDEVFWDRLEQMPAWEAEQELVLRRERNQLELAVLTVARSEVSERPGKQSKREAERIGVEIQSINRQMTRINERIKYLRRLMDRLQWKEAVKAVFGDEGYEQCVVWIEQNYGEIHNKRREWNGSR